MTAETTEAPKKSTEEAEGTTEAESASSVSSASPSAETVEASTEHTRDHAEGPKPQDEAEAQRVRDALFPDEEKN